MIDRKLKKTDESIQGRKNNTRIQWIIKLYLFFEKALDPVKQVLKQQNEL